MHRVEQGPRPAPEQPEALDAEGRARDHGRACDDPRPPHGRRPLALRLLAAAAAAGILLQLGPAHASSEKARRSAAPATKQQALAAYARLPLAFVANAGQTDARVRYSAQGAGFSVFLTRKEAMLALQRPGTQGRGKGAALALRFLGSKRNVAIRGERPKQGRVNYLLGNDPATWHTGLRTYERVVYRDLWPGVDLAFTGQNGKLKYEFLVRPGARVSEIRLAYRGPKRLSLDRKGNLRIRTSLGVLTDRRPASYQLVAGKRVAVRSSFALAPHGRRYSFAVESAYDRRYPLVIDPGLGYSTYLGGSSDDFGDGLALDGAGSAYLTGYTSSANFPTTAGAFDTTYNGGVGDAFVTKLDVSGAALLYSTYLGGSGGDFGNGIALDGAGSAYVTGETQSADFPTTASAFDRTYNGARDAFITKLDASGAALGYSTYLGPVVRCRVPRVIGMTLGRARTRIRARHCRVGRVRRARSRRVGRVLSQSPRAGVRRARGARVNLVVGRR